MSLDECESKSEVIEKYCRHKSDTGSPEVQIAVLTWRLGILSKHFEKHSQDKHSRERGLRKIVSQRKRLLNYLKREDVTRYRTVLTQFGLRK